MDGPRFASFPEFATAYRRAVSTIVTKTPALRDVCAVHGSGPASVLHLQHRESWDIDLIGIELMAPVEHLADRMAKAHGKALEWTIYDSDSQMFSGVLHLNGLPPVEIDLFRNVFTDQVLETQAEDSFGGLEASTLKNYVNWKFDSCVDRCLRKDAMDLVACNSDDIAAEHVIRAVHAGSFSDLRRLNRLLEGCHAHQPFPAAGYSQPSADAFSDLREMVTKRVEKFRLVQRARAQSLDFP